ncbi:flavin reductase [Limnothrix sp. FACHB-708]|uniref:diflavin flavoprotein n=1 Tax=unclassified Limnothrix TaxID=2632864 RepID=UPI0016886927|nr:MULTISPECIES: diflavin flavoprotein [unclassified Limnothrix]MBD2553662.1 flavin reductase [Limnothrix sp. FACHB-708]MBD2591133.1 flavin reductase [Limnothrix sp. FACHB-406]
MTIATATPPTAKPRDVQVMPIGPGTTVLRSRTWERLKFEIEYSLKKGTTANAYLIQGDQVALIDPPGQTFTDVFLNKLAQRLGDRVIDYVILGHLNANRAATIERLLEASQPPRFICSNPAAITLRSLFPDRDLVIEVVRGEETLDLGQGHLLKFIPIPTPRWPDGMVTYDPASQIAFTDKLYGAHVCGDQIFDEGWQIYEDDRRFYYDCLHASQSKQVSTALDKLDDLPAATYAPGHGPIVRYGFAELRHAYRHWTQQQTEKELSVALIFASAYGNTAAVAQSIARGITKAGVAVESINCEYLDPEEIKGAIEKCAGFIIGSPTLGGHAPTQIQTALGIVLNSADKSKPAGVFGSFGWSGEAIDLLESKLQDGGYQFAMPTIRVKFAPTQAVLQQCEEAGTDFAQALQRANKRRAPKPAAGTADRTAQAVGRVVGSLCVVTASQDDVQTAMLASWVSQATFKPPGVTIAVAKERAIESLMHEGSQFVLNVLAEGKQLRRHFMKNFPPGADRFEGLQVETASNGCPVLTDALAFLECTVRSRMECGDHWVVYATANSGKVLDTTGVTAVHHRRSGSQY